MPQAVADIHPEDLPDDSDEESYAPSDSDDDSTTTHADTPSDASSDDDSSDDDSDDEDHDDNGDEASRHMFLPPPNMDPTEPDDNPGPAPAPALESPGAAPRAANAPTVTPALHADDLPHSSSESDTSFRPTGVNL
eukprot:scaffold20842_cov100-Cylindrotheca_fusiformis.AAC.1